MEWVGGVDGIGGVGEAVRSSVCRILFGGLDLFDHDLLALQQVCLAATAMGTGLAVLDRRVVAATCLAMRHSLDGLHNKLRALRDRLLSAAQRQASSSKSGTTPETSPNSNVTLETRRTP